jgi:phosphopantothenoylcysteine decarboxylase/phosphopantothenate--cysteine ligase
MTPATGATRFPLRPRPLREARLSLGLGPATDLARLLETLGEIREMGLAPEVFVGQEARRRIGPAALAELGAGIVHEDAQALAGWLEAGHALRGDAFLLLGATGPTVARLARGIPERVEEVAVLSFAGEVFLELHDPACAWERDPWVSHLSVLRDQGWHVLRFQEGDVLDAALGWILQRERACRVLVTAGPTRERIDPVRYLSNDSSGRMGYEIARAVRDAGYAVTLVSGPTPGLKPPRGVTHRTVVSAEEMLSALRQIHRSHPILIMAAAVADYRPAQVEPEKIRRDRERRSLNLVANPDILASLAPEREGMVTVGFAIEGGLDEAAVHRAAKKIEKKKVSFLVLNDPSRPDSAFGGTTVRARLIWNPRCVGRGPWVEDLPTMTKRELGSEILERAVAILEKQGRGVA